MNNTFIDWRLVRQMHRHASWYLILISIFYLLLVAEMVIDIQEDHSFGRLGMLCQLIAFPSYWASSKYYAAIRTLPVQRDTLIRTLFSIAVFELPVGLIALTVVFLPFFHPEHFSVIVLLNAAAMWASLNALVHVARSTDSGSIASLASIRDSLLGRNGRIINWPIWLALALIVYLCIAPKGRVENVIEFLITPSPALWGIFAVQCAYLATLAASAPSLITNRRYSNDSAPKPVNLRIPKWRIATSIQKSFWLTLISSALACLLIGGIFRLQSFGGTPKEIPVNLIFVLFLALPLAGLGSLFQSRELRQLPMSTHRLAMHHTRSALAISGGVSIPVFAALWLLNSPLPAALMFALILTFTGACILAQLSFLWFNGAVRMVTIFSSFAVFFYLSHIDAWQGIRHANESLFDQSTTILLALMFSAIAIKIFGQIITNASDLYRRHRPISGGARR